MTNHNGDLFVTSEDVIDGKLTITGDIPTINRILGPVCDTIEELVIYSSTNLIADRAFSKCKFLKKITLPDDLESLSEEFFSYDALLEEVILPKKLKRIGKKCFCECTRLNRIEIPPGVTSILSQTFYKCVSLKEVVLSDNLIKIGASAFARCSNLKKIILPDTLTGISKNAFADSGISEILFPYGISCISECAFANCKQLKEIHIPSNIKRICDEAFVESGLENIIFDEGVEIIGYNSFSLCQSLKSVVLPNSLLTIEERAFNECSNLESITFGNQLEKIGAAAFADCTTLYEIELPDSVFNIGSCVFDSCSNLKKVKLSRNLKSIGNSSFKFCSSLERIEIPHGITKIDTAAFCECSNLEDIKLPQTLNVINSEAFYGCESLKEIELPDAVKYIGRHAFTDCLTLEKIKLPMSLKQLKNNTFNKCVNLKEIILNETLESIGDYAFYQCNSLEELNVPDSVRWIGRINNCPKLSKITLYSKTSLQYWETNNDKSVSIIVKHKKTGNQKKIYINFQTRMINCNDGFLLKDNDLFCFFDLDGNWVQLDDNDNLLFNDIHFNYYVKGYEWMKKSSFMPSIEVLEEMPIDEIDNFYINNNSKRWKSLIDIKGVKEHDKRGLFKLAYVMGLFHKKGKISEAAYDFLISQTIEPNQYHVEFCNLDIEKNKYNNEFRLLILEEYKLSKKEDFLSSLVLRRIFSKVYNNFEKIKKAHPFKRVRSKDTRDKLTLNICEEALRITDYENVEKGNEDLAYNIGTYGYSQSEFEWAQQLFNIGKRISKKDLCLFISEDDKRFPITYELLEKDNPLGVILGDLTNCCQTLNGMGKECVGYGLSKRNSKFMVFRLNGKLIGQSWVWYDENTKRICLDNIEIPTTVIKDELTRNNIQNGFIAALERCVEGFLFEMGKMGFEVDSITVGEGYNDLGELLKQFPKVLNQPRLSDYSGYSDAKNQFILYSNDKKG